MQTGTLMPCPTQAGFLLGKPRLPRPASCTRIRSTRLICNASQDHQNPERQLGASLAVPMTAVLAAALMFSAAVPSEALAARSSGRVGGSAFRSAPRAAPRPSGGGGGGGGGTTINRNYNINSYSAPPLVGGYGGGFSPFGGGYYAPSPLFGFGPVVSVPLIGGGGFFSFIFGLFVVTTVLNVVRSVVSRRENDDDEF